MFCFHAGWWQLFLCKQELPAVDLKCLWEHILLETLWIRLTSKKFQSLPDDNHIIYISAIEDEVFSKGDVGSYMKTCPVSHTNVGITGAKLALVAVPTFCMKKPSRKLKQLCLKKKSSGATMNLAWWWFKLLCLAKNKYSRACRPIGWGVDVYKDKTSRETQIYSAYHV